MSRWLARLLPMLLAGAVLLGVALAVAPGCGSRGSRRVGQMPSSEVIEDRPVSNPEVLQRELEITVLENYLQLTLGNMEAYADTIARDREVTLIGIGADQVATGTLPEDCSPTAAPGRICGSSRDRLPFRSHTPCGIGSAERAPCLGVYSKNLQLHMSQDGSTAWVFDELAYRVPHQGREASIPLRFTAVFVRDVDRWVMVMEHLSYAMPTKLVLELARDGSLTTPRPMPARDIDLVRARLLLAQVSRRLKDQVRPQAVDTPADGSAGTNGDAESEAGADADGETGNRTAGTASASPDAGRSREPGPLLWPDPYAEFHGPSFDDAPSLASMLGPDTRITMHNIRLALSESERVAWLAANLHARQGSGDGAVKLGMRLTAVFERGAGGQWNIMQMHVSVPVSQSQMQERVLGNGLR